MENDMITNNENQRLQSSSVNVLARKADDGAANNDYLAQNDSSCSNANKSTIDKPGTTQAIMQGAFGSVVASFDQHDQAIRAANQLRQSGFTTEEINVVTKEENRTSSNEEFYDDDVTDGVLTGGTIGGIGGLLAGAGALLIPGVGPILATGPIAAAISGAAIGGIAGGLIDYGIPAEASSRYEEKVARGESITVVKTSLAKVNQAAQVLRKNGAVEVEVHEM